MTTRKVERAPDYGWRVTSPGDAKRILPPAEVYYRMERVVKGGAGAAKLMARRWRRPHA